MPGSFQNILFLLKPIERNFTDDYETQEVDVRVKSSDLKRAGCRRSCGCGSLFFFRFFPDYPVIFSCFFTFSWRPRSLVDTKCLCKGVTKCALLRARAGTNPCRHASQNNCKHLQATWLFSLIALHLIFFTLFQVSSHCDVVSVIVFLLAMWSLYGNSLTSNPNHSCFALRESFVFVLIAAQVLDLFLVRLTISHRP